MNNEDKKDESFFHRYRDKLIHLLNYAYHDITYYPVGGIGNYLYYYTFRLLTNGQHKISERLF